MQDSDRESFDWDTWNQIGEERTRQEEQAERLTANMERSVNPIQEQPLDTDPDDMKVDDAPADSAATPTPTQEAGEPASDSSEQEVILVNNPCGCILVLYHGNRRVGLCNFHEVRLFGSLLSSRFIPSEGLANEFTAGTNPSNDEARASRSTSIPGDRSSSEGLIDEFTATNPAEEAESSQAAASRDLARVNLYDPPMPDTPVLPTRDASLSPMDGSLPLFASQPPPPEPSVTLQEPPVTLQEPPVTLQDPEAGPHPADVPLANPETEPSVTLPDPEAGPDPADMPPLANPQPEPPVTSQDPGAGPHPAYVPAPALPPADQMPAPTLEQAPQMAVQHPSDAVRRRRPNIEPIITAQIAQTRAGPASVPAVATASNPDSVFNTPTTATPGEQAPHYATPPSTTDNTPLPTGGLPTASSDAAAGNLEQLTQDFQGLTNDHAEGANEAPRTPSPRSRGSEDQGSPLSPARMGSTMKRKMGELKVKFRKNSKRDPSP